MLWLGYRGACADDPMPRDSGFQSTITSLWFRLISLGIVGLGFAEGLLLASGKVQGWSYYLPAGQVAFEVVVHLLFAALAGIVLGTICTAALAPFLWYFGASRERLAEWATRVAVVLVVFPASRMALIALIKWSNRGVRFTTALLIAHFLVFVIALCIPRTRREVVTSLDGFLGEKMTRRTALATVGGAAALAATEFALGKTARAKKGSLRPLKEAHIWNLDRSAENPELAEALRAAIYLRFPDLPKL